MGTPFDASFNSTQSGSKVSRFDAGFNTAHFEGQNGLLKMARQIMVPGSHGHMAHQIYHVRSNGSDNTSDPTYQIAHLIQHTRWYV